MISVIQLININIDLLSVGIASAAIAILGFGIYFSNRQSLIHKSFLAFALVTVIWGISNYLEYKFDTIVQTLWALRVHLFISVWHAFLFFTLSYVFPFESIKFPKWYKYFLVPIVILTSLLTLTPLVFSGITELAPQGYVTNPERGFGIAIFSAVAFGLLIAGLVSLLVKAIKFKGVERQQTIPILIGMFLTACLILLFNVVLPVVLNNLGFIPLAVLFILPFIGLSSYAIFKHKLFNLKVVGASVLVFILSVVNFGEVIFADNQPSLIYRSVTLSLILLFGVLLIKSVVREVEQRQQIEELAARLKSVNSILSHDVKATLGKNKGLLASLLEGDFGPISPEAKPLMEQSHSDTKKLIDVVMNILASGKDLVLNKTNFDFKASVLEVLSDVKKDADDKGLKIETKIDDGDYHIMADKPQMTAHVLHNLIENAINYNIVGGSIIISLSKKDDKLLFIVKDTGYGIKDEDKPNIFKEGGRGKESIKINVHSSGYGLSTVKKTVDAHGGKIWFESEGIPGRGTTFFVELSKLTNLGLSSNI